MDTYLNKSLKLIALLSLASAAQAHIVLENPKAEAGGHYKAVFQVGHGCSGSPIRQIVVEIPEGVGYAKPMPKAGWKIEIDMAKLAKPYTTPDGPVTDYATQVRWIGGTLAANHYDEFVLLAKLPEKAGPLYWKVSQLCDQGRVDWAEIPADGKKLFDYKTPAAVVEIMPKGAGASHH